MLRFIPVEIFENKLQFLKNHYRGQALLDVISQLEINIFKMNLPEPFNSSEEVNYKINSQSVPYIYVNLNTCEPILSFGKQVIRFNVDEYGKTLK